MQDEFSNGLSAMKCRMEAPAGRTIGYHHWTAEYLPSQNVLDERHGSKVRPRSQWGTVGLCGRKALPGSDPG